MKDHLTRRQFMQTAGCVAAAGFLGKQRTLIRSPQDNPPDFDLVLVSGDPERAVARGLACLGGLGRFVRPGNTVLLKPNVSFPNPKEWGSTTSPEVVSAVARLALEAGASRILVADNTMREGDLCFRKTGLAGAFKGVPKVKIIPLQKESFFKEVSVPKGQALQSVKIAKLVRQCDVVINMPCAKSHSATEVSFGLKNLMGLIWDRNYFHNSTDLHQAIAELSMVIRPHLTIMDATRAMVTGGPTGPGKVQPLHSILISTDPLAVDAYTVSLAQWNNRMQKATFIKHLAHASELGVGKIELKSISVHSEQI